VSCQAFDDKVEVLTGSCAQDGGRWRTASAGRKRT